MMEPTDGSPPNSMYMVRCGEMFPKPVMEKEDEKLGVPFKELPGEGVKYIGETTDGVLALTNYRIFVLRGQQEKSVPLGLIDTVQSRDLFHLIVNCKDANTVKCSFETTEKCSEWQRRITMAVSSLTNFNSLFAFPFYAWSSDQSELLSLQQQRAVSAASRSSSPGTNANNNSQSNGTLAMMATEAEWSSRLRKISSQDYDEEFRKEVERLQFNLRGAWRISKINEDFKLCPSYPRHFLVPTYITDETLQSVANFRSSRRIPVAVWRHRTTGAIIARCSQPEVGWLGWRNNKDEELLQAFVNACAFDQGEQQQLNNNQLMVIGDGNSVADWNKAEYGTTTTTTGCNAAETEGLTMATVGLNNNGSALNASDGESVSSAEGSHEEVRMDKPKKMLIVDARSYASAVTNRARGGGCECIDYYPSAEIQFMNLANIHAVRKSFNALRQLCASPPDMGSWLSNLEKTLWLQHLSGLLAASVTVVTTIEVEGRPVLVHCSDGWDRTPQIVATAQLCLDPYYRTVNGFKTLVEREWLSFGHKYGDRCGHGPNSYELNERCPVFLQWLDCVHQIHNQFPCSFEFSIGYLIKLAQHSHSGLFGTFLANTMRERIENSIFDRTYSVWPFLSGPMYKNALYVPNRQTVLWPAYNIRDLTLWNEVYLGNLHINHAAGATAITFNSEAFGTKMETMLEQMETVEGDDKLDLGTLNLEMEDDQIETIKMANGEPVSPMSKTRSYGDLLEANGPGSTGPHRRCSDPTIPIELIKQNGHLNGMLAGQRGVMINSDIEGEDSDGSFKKEEYGPQEMRLVRGNAISQDPIPMACKLNQIVGESTEEEEEEEHQQQTINGFLGDQGILAQTTTPLLTNVIPPGVLELQTACDEDSVDGSPSPREGTAHCDVANLDVMLESVDLRVTTIETANNTKGNNLWHGNVETSTDTLVPTSALTEEESLHFPGSCNGDLSNFLTKREENEEMRRQRIDNRIQNGIDCSVYGENTFNMALLNDQSLYDSTMASATRATEMPTQPNGDLNGLNINIMDMSLIENVIQSQPISAKRRQMETHHQRHRRTPSNSKSEPSPHKSQNGNMSPSATMTSRFSTPGGRSPNLTPPDGPVFEKANNVILSCPDGLAHALSEQNIRLQQIIYEHKLREEALQRELNATRLALLKRICYQCNNQAPSSNHEEQDLSVVRVGGDDGVEEEEEVDVGDSGSVDGEEEEEEDDDDSESGMNTDQHMAEFQFDFDVDDDSEDDLRNLFRSIEFHDAPPDPMTCSKSRLATNPNMDMVGENISVCSWEAVEERGGGSGGSSTSVQSDPMSVPINSKVLWVPDHAVNKCTGCSFEFWIGRRKHHCRSCGKIFCSDCSEFFAPLPEERLYNPVRLCGPCYLSVTTKLQSQHDQQKYQNQQPQPADQGMMDSYSSSSIINHNYSHLQPLSPSSSSLPSNSDSSLSVTASSPTPQLKSAVVVVKEEHVPAEPIQSISYANGCVDRSIMPEPTITKSVSIHRNKSSCSLEAGDPMLRQSLERSSPSLMSVSDVGPVMVGSLKTATASN